MLADPAGKIKAGEATIAVNADDNSWEQEQFQLGEESKVILILRCSHGGDDPEPPGGERKVNREETRGRR
eukprot:11176582-Prorocentrum_lima.AAC.1